MYCWYGITYRGSPLKTSPTRYTPAAAEKPGQKDCSTCFALSIRRPSLDVEAVGTCQENQRFGMRSTHMEYLDTI